jgi:hypothetical protein
VAHTATSPALSLFIDLLFDHTFDELRERIRDVRGQRAERKSHGLKGVHRRGVE